MTPDSLIWSMLKWLAVFPTTAKDSAIFWRLRGDSDNILALAAVSIETARNAAATRQGWSLPSIIARTIRPIDSAHRAHPRAAFEPSRRAREYRGAVPGNHLGLHPSWQPASGGLGLRPYPWGDPGAGPVARRAPGRTTHPMGSAEPRIAPGTAPATAARRPRPRALGKSLDSHRRGASSAQEALTPRERLGKPFRRRISPQ